GEAVDLLASCYRNSLEVARAAGAKSVAFPGISTGIYHFPKPLAATTAVDSVTGWVAGGPGTVETVTFVCFGLADLELYEQLLAG
ncbi:MAG: macro domain-containing protein, partial [Acidimicrobiia bacterium]